MWHLRENPVARESFTSLLIWMSNRSTTFGWRWGWLSRCVGVVGCILYGRLFNHGWRALDIGPRGGGKHMNLSHLKYEFTRDDEVELIL